jgi:hypothetical protein
MLSSRADIPKSNAKVFSRIKGRSQRQSAKQLKPKKTPGAGRVRG